MEYLQDKILKDLKRHHYLFWERVSAGTRGAHMFFLVQGDKECLGSEKAMQVAGGSQFRKLLGQGGKEPKMHGSLGLN